MHTLQNILATLISYPSITPHDVGCQDYMQQILQQAGFHVQRFDNPPVANFYAEIGKEGPLLIFAGHTDVVPIGERSQWLADPFQLHEQDGKLYGRGVADMKGSLACMLAAATQFVEHHPQFNGRLGFLITSGEEGDDFNLGTPYVMQQLHAQHIHPDFCIVGEPSSSEHVGDVIKIGRRGSLTGYLTLHGKQGHVAYPHLAENPIHTLSPALTELVACVWDQGNAHFPPTTFQITHIHAGGQATNVIPGELTAHFNFRYSTEQSAPALKQAVHACFASHGLKPHINWLHNGEPFLTAQGHLLDSCIQVIQHHTGKMPQLSTSGGTSDGRFIAPFGVEVIELGLVNATIHQINEHILAADLTRLKDIYYSLCERILS